MFGERSCNLHCSKNYIALDCYSGFLADQHKGGTQRTHRFFSPIRAHEFNKLPFCFSNSPPSFQQLIVVVLKDLFGTECWDFIDGVVIFIRSVQERAQRLENLLQGFDKANLHLHPWQVRVRTASSELPRVCVPRKWSFRFA